MTTIARIQISFRSYWLSGTGAGLGRTADKKAYRDVDGLPALPSEQIKGILREVGTALESGGTLPSGFVETTFGNRKTGRDGRAQGLRFEGDVRVPARYRSACREQLEDLTRSIASTAISERGVAKDRTLRASEVAVPLQLELDVPWFGSSPPDEWDKWSDSWIGLLDLVCAGTTTLGAAKFDGYGEAVLECRAVEAVAPSTAEAVDSPPSGARVLELRLTQTQRAGFGDRPATEGVQHSLAAPTGASFLGWCARRYLDFEDPTAIFHSGAVRFCSATPSTNAKVVPIPKTFAAPKERASAWDATGRIDVAVVRNGRPSADGTKEEAKGTDDIQYEAVGSGWMTEDLRKVGTRRSARTRTATEGGRAAEAQLFTMEHIEPDTTAVFCARVEIDDTISTSDAQRIAETFHNQDLLLGRDKFSGQGGTFRCSACWVSAKEPERVAFEKGDVIPVLCLSDVAATDCFGNPTSIIDPALLGLAGGRLDRRRSVVGHRRYAPWNGHLRRRMQERSVIEAGSVLVFVIGEATSVASRQILGSHTEEGLGLVWIAPPFLQEWRIPEPAESGLANSDGLAKEIGSPDQNDPWIAWITALPRTVEVGS